MDAFRKGQVDKIESSTTSFKKCSDPGFTDGAIASRGSPKRIRLRLWIPLRAKLEEIMPTHSKSITRSFLKLCWIRTGLQRAQMTAMEKATENAERTDKGIELTYTGIVKRLSPGNLEIVAAGSIKVGLKG